MEKKYTTITISKELSKRIRLMAIQKGMRTQKLLEFLCDEVEGKDNALLLDEVTEDLKEINRKNI